MEGMGRTGRDILRWLMNPLVLGGALVVALILLAVTLSLLYYTRPEDQEPAGQPTAVFNVIPGPSATPEILISPTAPFSQTLEAAPAATTASGAFGIGVTVQVAGTGGDGLRLRSTPGLQGEVLLLAAEGEAFEVQDGPREADGYIWWLLVSPEDEQRQGWGVENFLSVVEAP